VLLIEHNLEMVLNLCDKVTVMVNGSVLFSGTPDEVRTHPQVLEAYIGSHGGQADDGSPVSGTTVIHSAGQAQPAAPGN
jgi:ABC-type multidrug transport system ATPase subunit